jgi:hypothetical protein
MRNKWLFLLFLAGAALLLRQPTLSAQERSALPILAQPSPTLSFGMLGLGTGQTARLNVVNLVRTAPPLAVSIAQVPCKVELDLYDGQGKLIKQKTVANLGFGQADFLDLLRSELNTTAAHVDISGVVKSGSTQSFTCSVSATLEVFDNVTGVTTAILANTNSSFGFIVPVLSSTPPTPQQ